MVLRSRGRIRVRHDYKAEATYALWRQGFFEKPALAGPAEKVPFAPHDYGMVFIDADRKWVGSIQGYGDVNHHELPWVLETGMGGEILPLTPASHPVVLKNSYTHDHRRGEQSTPIVSTGTSLDHLRLDLEDAQRRALEERQANGWTMLDDRQYLALDLPEPWRVEEFNRSSPTDWHAFIARLVEHGVSPSREETEAWRNYFSFRDLPESLALPFEAPHRQDYLRKALPKVASPSPRKKGRL